VAQLQAGGDVTAVSPLYETEPVGGPEDQGAFLNVVVELATPDSPQQLLVRCHELEEAAHRVRTVRFGPRTLDADLVVPHPRMWERRFVLQPLADLAPELVPDDQLIAAGGAVNCVGKL
jgi:2-amino-4-hydroxy-6-hydroxymethyldihydropteridine diphosphokinase